MIIGVFANAALVGPNTVQQALSHILTEDAHIIYAEAQFWNAEDGSVFDHVVLHQGGVQYDAIRKHFESQGATIHDAIIRADKLVAIKNVKTKKGFEVLPKAVDRDIFGLNKSKEDGIPDPDYWDKVHDDMWSGQACFVIGGGESLKYFNWKLLKKKNIIATNRAIENLPNAQVFVTVDHRFLNWSKPDTNIFRESDSPDDPANVYEDFAGTAFWVKQASDKPAPEHKIIIHELKEVEKGLSMSLKTGLHMGINNGKNTGLAALNLAICTGANPIYLLGFDHNPEPGMQQHYHSGYPITQNGNVYATFKKSFQGIADHAKQLTRIINVNPKSGLDCFEFGPLPWDKQKSKKPKVINFYTELTSYEAMAKQMQTDIESYGYETDIVEEESMGGWQANTYYKAEFMLDKMHEHEKTNLLWLDADLRVKSNPRMFEDMEGVDIAVSRVDWSKYPKHARDDHEVNTSVVFLRNVKRVREFMRRWVDLNEERIDSGVWEQKNMQDLLEVELKRKKPRIKIKWLPDSYAQIHDIMKSNGAPVIELHQASRTTKKEVGK